MDYMQLSNIVRELVDMGFQYRKRYGLHATKEPWDCKNEDERFQYCKRYGLHAIVAFLMP